METTHVKPGAPRFLFPHSESPHSDLQPTRDPGSLTLLVNTPLRTFLVSLTDEQCASDLQLACVKGAFALSW